jgi:hypothetical protein
LLGGLMLLQQEAPGLVRPLLLTTRQEGMTEESSRGGRAGGPPSPLCSPSALMDCREEAAEAVAAAELLKGEEEEGEEEEEAGAASAELLNYSNVHKMFEVKEEGQFPPLSNSTKRKRLACCRVSVLHSRGGWLQRRLFSPAALGCLCAL